MIVSKSCLAAIKFELVIRICYVLNTSGFLKRWWDFLSCASLSYDCEEILFCSYHIWTHNMNVLRPKHIWILEEMMWFLILCFIKLWLWAILFCSYNIWTRNTNVLRPEHVWILEEMMGSLFLCSFKMWLVSKSCFAIIADELVICFMVHFDANMLLHKHVWILDRWCDCFSCAPLRCDCEQILFCNNYNEFVVRFMAHFDAIMLRHKHIWNLE